MHTSNRSALIRTLAVIALAYFISGLTPASARPIYFRYTSIADTSEHFFSHLNSPCINNLSRIAFTGRLSSGVEGVFSRVNLGGFDTLADSGTSNYVSFGLDCSINHNAMIEFVGLKKVSDGFDRVVLRGTGNSSSPLIDSTGTYDEFSSFQINIVGKSVLGARRASDHANVILVKGSGSLTGPQRVVVPGTGAISQYSSFATNPTINSSGTIAVAATKSQNHTIHILTIDESGLVTQFLDDSGPFIGIDDVTINNSGSILFAGIVLGGERGVWRLDQVGGSWNLTQLASSNTTECVQFNAMALSDLDVAAFSCNDFNSFSYVYLSDQQGLHKIQGFGSQLFGRRVQQASIGREAINSDKHVAMLIDFDNGSSAIVRADPTYIPPDLVTSISGAFQLEVSADGGGPSITTPIHVRPNLMLLSFDVVFPSRTTGELHVLLGDKLLKSIAASRPGGQQHISIPVDLRKDPRIANGVIDQLRFEITGKSGAAAQISNVVIPGVISDSMQANAGKRWHIDAKGGHAAIIDTTPFPVKVEIALDGKQTAPSKNRAVPVAILSSDGFDATHDIDRNTLTFNGTSLPPDVKPETKQNTTTPASCNARDVNADKLPDLVCDVVLATSAKSTKDQTVRVEATSIYGWRIAGSNETGGGQEN